MRWKTFEGLDDHLFHRATSRLSTGLHPDAGHSPMTERLHKQDPFSAFSSLLALLRFELGSARPELEFHDHQEPNIDR